VGCSSCIEHCLSSEVKVKALSIQEAAKVYMQEITLAWQDNCQYVV
jgi:hypothetical protein